MESLACWLGADLELYYVCAKQVTTLSTISYEQWLNICAQSMT